MALKSTNTQAEVLTSILGDISTAKTLPDADLPFLVELETMVLGKLREPLDQQSSQMGPQGGAVPPMGGPGGGELPPMPPDMGPPPAPPGGVPGLRNPGPSPDELSRLLG